MYPEIKYQKFALLFGQSLHELPDYLSWKQEGWNLEWSYSKIENGRPCVETLLVRNWKRTSVSSLAV